MGEDGDGRRGRADGAWRRGEDERAAGDVAGEWADGRVLPHERRIALVVQRVSGEQDTILEIMCSRFEGLASCATRGRSAMLWRISNWCRCCGRGAAEDLRNRRGNRGGRCSST